LNADNKKENVLIFDASFGGHHLKYVEILLNGFHEMGYEVYFASSVKTFQSLEYGLLLQKHEHIFNKIIIPVVSVGGYAGMIERSFRLFMLLFRHKWDMVFLPYLDGLLYLFGPVGSIMQLLGWRLPPTRGILLCCDFIYPENRHIKSQQLKEWLFKKIAKAGPLEKIFLIDEFAYEYLSKESKCPHVSLCPDPVEYMEPADKESVLSKLGIPPNAKVVGAFGLLSSGKGVDRLVQAFLERRPGVREYMLLMGKQTVELKSKLSGLLKGHSARNNVIIINRFVDDVELLSAISAVNVVAVTYPYQAASASFLIRAAAAGRPVLASNTGWIGNIMKKYRLGHSCSVLDEVSLLAGLDWAFENPENDCPDATAFAAKHTIEYFKSAVLLRG
jgi:glycosyltransferase involved in cell wall biosynthesis